jgi:Leucine-rich repeat (LRR) protein
LKTLRSLDLGGTKLPESAMEKVAAMPSLSILQLYGSNISGKGLHLLAGKKELTELLLEQTGVSAEDLTGMRAMPRLARLHLNGPKTIVTDAGAKTIASTFSGLTALRIDAKDLTITGFSELAGIKNLSDITVVGASRLDAEWLTALSRIKGLSKLSLPGSAIKDSDVPNLEPLKDTLQELHLENTRLSDAAIPALGKLKSLRILTISGTDITKDGADSLRKSLHGCEIRY